MEMIEIDGSVGEGGGQILRSSLALAMCTGRSVSINRIRAKRPKPGLMRQHLTCVQAAAAICGATLSGAELRSESLVFVPGPVRGGDYRFNVGSAGSCTLVLQTVLPALMLAGAVSRLSLVGGTHNPMAPPFHFLERSFAPLVRRLGVGLDLQLVRHGFYPAGGGEIVATIRPATSGMAPVDLIERGALAEQHAECLAAGIPKSVATRELEVLAKGLGWSGEQLRAPTLRQDEGPGNALIATLVHANVVEVFTGFGEKQVSAEKVAGALIKEIRAYKLSDAALGPYLADQWMLPLALAVTAMKGAATFTCSEITGHAQTNIGTIETFLPVRFEISSGEKHSRLTVKFAPTDAHAQPDRPNPR